jgi:uncharacterized protein with HEPN domain
MPDPRRLRDYLTDIAEAIDRVASYTARINQSDFPRDRLIQDAVIRNIEIIGEASHQLLTRFPEYANAQPQLPLASAYGMRNVVAHGYFHVDLDILWATVETSLPELRKLIQQALHDLDAQRSPPS